jgi:hypothetical protein
MKRFLLTIVLILQGFVVFAQSGSVDAYADLYDRLPSWQEKCTLLREMTAGTIEGAVNFYARAFGELTNAYQNIRYGSTEWTSANAIAHILISELISARYEAAGNELWRCYQIFTDSTVQSEALAALGHLKIDSHYADVEQVVNWLNAKSNTTNRQNDENIAVGGFTALEKYGKSEGYLAAFVGAEGWYREFVKQTARSAFNALLQDPASLLPDVILSPQYPPLLKQKALEHVDNASIDNTQKAEIASKSLAQGWRLFSSDQRIMRELISFRRLALRMIRKYGSDRTTETYTALTRSLREGNLDEKLDSIPALGAINTTESITIILSYVQTLNSNRRMSNSQPIDDRLMRSLIPAMSQSNDSRVHDMFQQVQGTPWSNTVLNMVQNALLKTG